MTSLHAVPVIAQSIALYGSIPVPDLTAITSARHAPANRKSMSWKRALKQSSRCAASRFYSASVRLISVTKLCADIFGKQSK